MKKTIFILLSFFLILNTIAMAGNVTITIPDELEVYGDIILLGDISEITGSEDITGILKNIEIRKSPNPGYSTNLSKSQIEMVLKNNGIDVKTIDLKMPKTVKVTRKSSKLSGKEIIKSALEYTKSQMPWKEEDVIITVQGSINDITVPSGNIQLVPQIPQNTKFIGNMAVPVEILEDGISIKKVTVTMNIRVYQQVLVAKNDIKKGDPLSIDGLTIEKRELNQYNLNYLTSGDEINGRVALVNIPKGTMITEKIIESPIMVKQGEIVTIIAKIGAVEVKATGKAKQNGRIGDLINVVNIDSGKELQGKVIDRGTVIIIIK